MHSRMRGQLLDAHRCCDRSNRRDPGCVPRESSPLRRRSARSCEDADPERGGRQLRDGARAPPRNRRPVEQCAGGTSPSPLIRENAVGPAHLSSALTERELCDIRGDAQAIRSLFTPSNAPEKMISSSATAAQLRQCALRVARCPSGTRRRSRADARRSLPAGGARYPLGERSRTVEREVTDHDHREVRRIRHARPPEIERLYRASIACAVRRSPGRADDGPP